MRIFVSGVMQGSRQDRDIDSQDYRQQIAGLLVRHIPGVEIVDPLQLHPNSVDYGPAQAKETLLAMCQLAGEVDALIAWLPHASLGTALEMWFAYENQVPVYTISPMAANWVVLTLSQQVFADLAALEAFVAAGGLAPAK